MAKSDAKSCVYVFSSDGKACAVLPGETLRNAPAEWREAVIRRVREILEEDENAEK